MITLFARIVSRATHPSDEAISLLVSGELRTAHEKRLLTHLAKCWECRRRRDAYEKAALLVVSYRAARLACEPPQDLGCRNAFLLQLDQMLGKTATVSFRSRVLASMRAIHLPNMNPVYTSAVIVGVAALALFFVWKRQPVTVSATQLLRRAEASDRTTQSGNSGVLYQKISITTPRFRVERELYRDAAGKRHRRPEAVTAKSDQVQDVLGKAGVDWNEPLSAVSYREWHDAQPVVTDTVSRKEGDLLTLVTKLPDSWIEEESLTVRASDFHPVERTIRTLPYGTIQIAEVNYAVLGWNAGMEALFDGAPSGAVPPRVPDVHRALVHGLPSPAQIDSAELAARIALNHTAADTQEQIAIAHDASGVVVKGIVATSQRKRELVLRLGSISYVHPEIISIEELSARRPHDLPAGPSGSQSYSAVQLSPLARFLQENRSAQEQLSQVSQRLLDASVAVQQGASRIAELQERFSSPGLLDAKAQTNLRSLLMTYMRATADGLDKQASVIAGLGIGQPAGTGASNNETSSSARTLMQASRRNQSLCQELITASPDTARSAPLVATDLQASIRHLRAVLDAIREQFQ